MEKKGSLLELVPSRALAPEAGRRCDFGSPATLRKVPRDSTSTPYLLPLGAIIPGNVKTNVPSMGGSD
jgi:hypothetical protein